MTEGNIIQLTLVEIIPEKYSALLLCGACVSERYIWKANISHYYQPVELMKISGHIINRSAKEFKAGVIPYYKTNDDQIVIGLVTSSDPAYGGSDPGIAKGGSESGETSAQCAVREAYEEMGIPESAYVSFRRIFDNDIRGMMCSYRMVVFAGELSEKPTITLSYEIERVDWFPIDLALNKIRKSQKSILVAFANHVANS